MNDLYSRVREFNCLTASLFFHGTAMTLIALGPALHPGLGTSHIGGSAEVIEIEFGPYEAPLAKKPSIVAAKLPAASEAVIAEKAPEPVPETLVKETPVEEPPPPAPKKPKEIVEKTPEPEVIPEPVLASSNAIAEEISAYEEPISDYTEDSEQSDWARNDSSIEKSMEEDMEEKIEPVPTPAWAQSSSASSRNTEDFRDEEKELLDDLASTKPQTAPIAEAAKKTEPLDEPLPIAESRNDDLGESDNMSGTSSEGATQSINSPQSGSPIVVRQNFLQLRQLPGNQPPTYSREMRLSRLEGRGQLVYFVNRNGQVSNIRLVQSTGHPALDQAAIDAFSNYRFVPGQEGYTVHNFEFSLRGPAEPDAGRLRTSFGNQ